jgi:hypothetical protein
MDPYYLEAVENILKEGGNRPGRKPLDWRYSTKDYHAALLRHFAAGQYDAVGANAMILWHQKKHTGYVYIEYVKVGQPENVMSKYCISMKEAREWAENNKDMLIIKAGARDDCTN